MISRDVMLKAQAANIALLKAQLATCELTMMRMEAGEFDSDESRANLLVRVVEVPGGQPFLGLIHLDADMREFIEAGDTDLTIVAAPNGDELLQEISDDPYQGRQ